MWPDDLDLSAELAAAGARARDAAAAAPDPAFASSLRDRLVAPLPAAAPVTVLAHRRSGIRDRLSSRRLAPMLAAALLLVAVAAAARTVLVGTDPAPAPTPAASLPVIAGPVGGGLIETASPTPTVSPTPTPTATATASPTPSPTPEPVATPEPTPKPTAVPTVKPTPLPTPTPAPTVGMALTLTGCNGGVVLEWSKVVDARFHHYATLRSTSAEIPAAYPPQGGAVEVAGSFVKDPAATSATDASAPTGTALYYRTMAFDAADQVIAVSPVRSAQAKAVAGLGTLTPSSPEPGKTTFTWAPYPGPGACFSYYKLVYSETDPAPSYLAGSAAWAAIGERGATSVTIGEPVPGTTYYVRLQAIRATATGKMVVAQTEVLTWEAP